MIWSTFASQMGVFFAVGGVCRLISISAATLCICTVHYYKETKAVPHLALRFILLQFRLLDSKKVCKYKSRMRKRIVLDS